MITMLESMNVQNKIKSAFALVNTYRLHFASNVHESLSEHSSLSNIGHVRNWANEVQKLGH